MGTADKLVQKVEAKTAAYAITVADWGKTFTNRGATGSVTFTLPAVSAVENGFFVEFFAVAAQDFVIAATANQIIAFNDVDADAITFSTSSEIVGAAATLKCDGTSWLAILHTEETATTTVTT